MHFKSSYRIFNITHPTHQLIGDKFSFFAEALDLINTKAGLFLEFEIDTHITFLESMLFIAEKALEDGGSREINLAKDDIRTSILNNPLLSKDDLIMSEHYSEHQKTIDQISGVDDSDLQQIREHIKELHDKISPTYVESLVFQISNKFMCNHSLSFHRNDFSYLARLVYSYFYLSGYSKRDISYFVNKLLSSEITRQGDRLYSSAPLPKDLYNRVILHNTQSRPYDKQLHSDLKKFVKARDQKQQIEGFLNLSNYEAYEYSLYFKVLGLTVESEQEELFQLTFFNSNSIVKDNASKYIRKYLENEDNCLVRTKVTAHSYEEAVDRGLVIVQEALNNIMYIEKKSFYLDRTGVFGFDDSYYYRNSIDRGLELNNYSLDFIRYKEQKIDSSPHTDFIRSRQSMLAEALSETNKERYIGLHWRFVDILIPNKIIKKKTGVRGNVLALAYLMMYFEQKAYKDEIQLWAYHIIINSRQYSSELGFTREEIHEISERKWLISLREINSRFKHVHTLYHVRRALDYSKRMNTQERLHFYIRFFTGVASHRNIYEHVGAKDELMTRKIQGSIHDILVRLIDRISFELAKEENKSKPVKEVIKELILKGEQISNR